MPFNRLYTFSLYAAAFLLPLGQPFSNYALACLVIMFLVSGNFQKLSKPFPVFYLVALPAMFYGLHLLGLLYSSNVQYGFLDVQTKFSYLLLPLIFTIKPFKLHESNKAKLFFIAGCMAVCIYNVAVALIAYTQTKNIDVFYYTTFSKTMHVQYLTIHLNLAILFILNWCFSNHRKAWQYLVVITIILFFFLNISLLSSRLATIVSYITVALFIVLKLKSEKGFAKYWPYALLIIATIIVTDYLSLSKYNRFKQVEILFEADNNLTKFDKADYNSTTLRIPLWINAAEVIENNKIFGVGTGDIKEELDAVYRKNKFSYAEAFHFSPHNQVLHTGIILGFVGIAMLLAMLLIPLYYSIRYKSYLLLSFIVIFFFNMMTESILERQAGIILFSFMYVILVNELFDDMRKGSHL